MTKPLPTLIFFPGAHHTTECYRSKPDNTSSWADYLSTYYSLESCELPSNVTSTGEDALNEYVEFITKQLNQRHLTLLAHSLSCPIVLKLCEVCPEYIDSCIFIEPAPIGNFMSLPEVTTNDGVISIQKSGYSFNIDATKMLHVPDGFVDRVTREHSKRFPQDPSTIMRYAAALIDTPPQLALERFNVNGSQLKIIDFGRISQRILVVTGTEDPLHNRDDAIYVKNLREHGLQVEHLVLQERGITGNGHMMMLETNSQQIISLIHEWLQKNT